MLSLHFNKRVKCPWTRSEAEKIFSAIQKETKASGELEVNVVGDKEITDLNFRYRGKNKTTDVLSFAWQEDKKVKTKHLGQIYLCYPQIARQAKQLKIKIKEELARMLIHGFLHILGYDHAQKKDAEKMFKIQEKTVCHYADC
jgi:probable rRNA maturation factor